jgi:myosin heavy subunit
MLISVSLQVNSTLKSPTEAPYSIGILDIFGFEVFELNSFEQLCINYANEKLQFHFNEVIFSEETAMYAAEGVPTESVVFEDNADCVKLIEGKPYGLLSLLEEECSLGNATDLSYIAKIDKTFGTGKSAANKFFVKNRTKPDCFSVCHFAGAVEYNVTNFLDKNRDTLSVTAREVMEASQVPLIAELFVQPPDPNAGSGGGKKGTGKSTLGGQFRNQLMGLLTTLYTTEPHFIRCVKPNHQKVGGIFDGQLALRQLRYAGLFEAIRIRKSGYAYRATFRVFANSYQILVDGMTKKREMKTITDQECCKIILEQVTADKHLEQNSWFVGTTKVFLKTNAHRTVLERQKVSRVSVYAVRIQARCQAFVAKMKADRVRFAALKEQARLKAERDKHSHAAKIIQKHMRRKLVLLMMRSMHNLIELRKVLARKEISKMKACLEKIDQQNKPASSAVLSAMFQHEVKVSGSFILRNAIRLTAYFRVQ